MTFYTGSRFHTNVIEQDDFTHSFWCQKGTSLENAQNI